MAKRQSKKAASATDWRQTAEGLEKYRAAKAAAQAAANADGMDRGIEWRDGTVSYAQAVAVFLLPRKHNRFGHEHTCEVVSCTDLSKCRPGHGPGATRPPSLVGPDYHGGSFNYERNRQRAADWHAAHPEFDCDFGLARSALAKLMLRGKPAQRSATRALLHALKTAARMQKIGFKFTL